MMFFAVPEGKSAKNRVYLDLVAADPKGNEFDLVSA
jgi:hypothetical protein